MASNESGIGEIAIFGFYKGVSLKQWNISRWQVAYTWY